MADSDTHCGYLSLRVSADFRRRLGAVQASIESGMSGGTPPPGVPNVSLSGTLRAAAERGLKLMEAELGLAEQKAEGAK